MRNCDNVKKRAHLDNYMVKCFWVEDEELIFLQGYDQNQFIEKNKIALTPRKALILITLPSTRC